MTANRSFKREPLPSGVAAVAVRVPTQEVILVASELSEEHAQWAARVSYERMDESPRGAFGLVLANEIPSPMPA